VATLPPKATRQQHLSHLTVDVTKVPTPLPTISPTQNYKVLGVELNTSMSFTAHYADDPLPSPPLSDAPPLHRPVVYVQLSANTSTALLAYSPTHNHTKSTAPYAVVHLVPSLPRTALHHPTSDLGYGLPSIKATAGQLTVFTTFLSSMATEAS
jgi:hypothetical protein